MGTHPGIKVCNRPAGSAGKGRPRKERGRQYTFNTEWRDGGNFIVKQGCLRQRVIIVKGIPFNKIGIQPGIDSVDLTAPVHIIPSDPGIQGIPKHFDPVFCAGKPQSCDNLIGGSEVKGKTL